ncbi:MAG: C10 family peptidase [Thermodesulforhabdaceae bacterium]
MQEKGFLKNLLRSLVLSIFLLIPSYVWSEIVSFSDAQIVAEKWLHQIVTTYGDWGGSKTPSIKDSAEIRGKDGELLGYKFSIHPAGHIVVPRITQLAAVKSYSTTEDFDVNDPRKESYSALIKDTLGATIDALKDRYGSLEAIPEQDLGVLSRHPSWKKLLEDYSSSDSMEMAPDWGPLLSSTWHQGTPFNDNCPIGDTSCTNPSCSPPRTVVGCVATAASQIAYYWKYPYSGTGSKSYTWDGDDSCGHTPGPQTLSATYSDSYDWDNMLDSYSGSYNSTQAAAVAELCYEMGVAFSMDYGVCASGAYTGDAQTVFPTYFKYANVIQKKDRSSYASSTAWFNEVIKPQFDSYLPRPIQYRIQNHSIVCDGARDGTTQYMHVNYGWGGSYDAWYAVDNLYCPWSGCSPNVEYAMVNIQPLNRLYTYVVGGDKKIYFKYMTYSGTLESSWETIPNGATDATPGVAVFRNRQYVVVKGNGSESLWMASRDGKGWESTSWTSISGGTSAAPSLASFNNRLYLAVKGGGSSTGIYYRNRSASGTWSSWSTLSGATNHSPALVSFNNKLYIFVRGTGGGIYYRSMDASGTWGSWKTIPGSTSHEPAVAVYNNKLYVAVKGSGSSTAIYYGYLNTSEAWSGWSTLSGATDKAPRLTVMPQTNKMYITVKGTSGDVYLRSYNGTSWSSWQNLVGSTQLSPISGVHYYYNPSETP